MKKIIFTLLITLCIVGCNKNTRNQPDNPSIWSPAGKRYASIFITEDDTFRLVDFTDTCAIIQSYYNHSKMTKWYMYNLSYPDLVLNDYCDYIHMHFRDTTIIFWNDIWLVLDD